MLELNQVGKAFAQSNCYALSFWWIILSCLTIWTSQSKYDIEEKKVKQFSWEKGRDEEAQSLDKEHQETATCNR